MDIVDFLPKYPFEKKSRYDNLNPYERDFNDIIFHKKEFYENRLKKVEQVPIERGVLMNHQKIIARYMSSRTPYEKIILIHSMGTGKTCSAIGAIEQVKNEENSPFVGALILASGTQLLDNFTAELVEKCTAGIYIPKNYNKLSDLTKVRRIKKATSYYSMETFQKFAKDLSTYSDDLIVKLYSNHIIVIDEVHNLRVQDKNETVNMYEQYHRFLHLVENCKIILLSGTPMKDSPKEIASVANLILPLDDQFPSDEDTFLAQYMEEKNNVYTMKPNKIAKFKKKLRGMVSFLREPHSTVQREMVGISGYGNLNHFIVNPIQMSANQSKVYQQALKSDTGGRKGVYTNSRESTLFVYPDGSYGTAGFEKYILTLNRGKNKLFTNTLDYRPSKELKKAIIGPDVASTIENIRQHSAIYAYMIEQILNTKGNCFIYSSIVRGSGAILFGLLLEMVGYSRSKGNESVRKPRYALLTSDASNNEIRSVVKAFNQSKNMHGEYIQVIIGSKAVSEGFSFSNVIMEGVLTPHWNYSETSQALARGIRVGSHNDLIKSGITPVVRIIQPVSIPKKGKSIDLLMYQTSEDKDVSIRNVLRVLMEVAFDCALNYLRNRVENMDGQRECEYMQCNYQCDGIDPDDVMRELERNELDYSTYQLYYTDPSIHPIQNKVAKLLQEYNELSLNTIIDILKDEHDPEEIENALAVLREEADEKFDLYNYQEFAQLYMKTPLQKIITRVEELYLYGFEYSLQALHQSIGEYTEVELLQTLNYMITNKSIILNKFGFPCYLREENNIYFLVANISSDSFLASYYAKNVVVNNTIDFTKAFDNSSQNIILQRIKKMCDGKIGMDEFKEIIQTIPANIQEDMIEMSIQAQNNNSATNLSRLVLEYFNSYIFNVENVWYSTFLSSTNVRCLNQKGVWQNCSEQQISILQDYKENIRDDMRQRADKIGIIGSVNPISGDFCIVDFASENKKADTDNRSKRSGRKCNTWPISMLAPLIVNRLKLEIPDYDPKSKLSHIKTAVIKTLKTRQQVIDAAKIKKFESSFSAEERRSMPLETLKRAVYWSGLSREHLCGVVKQWLIDNDLIQEDPYCGKGAKPKTVQTEKKATEIKLQAIMYDYKEALELKIKLLKLKEFNFTRVCIVKVGKRVVGAVLILDQQGQPIINGIYIDKKYKANQFEENIIKTGLDKVVNVLGQPLTIVLTKGQPRTLKPLYNKYLQIGATDGDKTTYTYG